MVKETEMTVLKEIRDLLKGLQPISVKVEEQRFIKLSDGWIQDKQTGLEWGPSSNKEMNWEDGKKYCTEHGGRLPNVNELFSLVNRTKYNPAATIPDMKSNWYWTSEEYASIADCAWCVYFYFGGVSTAYEGSYAFVRPVRSSK